MVEMGSTIGPLPGAEQCERASRTASWYSVCIHALNTHYNLATCTVNMAPGLLLLVGFSATGAARPPTWSPTPCLLQDVPTGSTPGERSTETMSAWFADAGSKIFLRDEAPTAPCGGTAAPPCAWAARAASW